MIIKIKIINLITNKKIIRNKIIQNQQEMPILKKAQMFIARKITILKITTKNKK